MSKIGPALSPVDYDAWQRGYMPPSEHILIDELAYRGARVVCSSNGGDIAFWLVVKGDIKDRKALSAITRSLHEQFFVLEESLDDAAKTPIAEAPA